ncbi:hypothetical protein [Demequina oxidasica]|uniref:hypothetical protein n=1 Tax=Demequina oxidasica TaxID=676199 RepID=UPI00078195F4|nr:hypothetical protein [Demequina oxidasica]
MNWYTDNILDTGRAPALWLLIGFIVTFAVTRAITRKIRGDQNRPAEDKATDEKGGLLSDIHIGGVHIHHQVWGILLVLVTGTLQFRYAPEHPWAEVLAALFGAGAALALDEFALWLHLDDVYWSNEGRKSIDAILVAGVLAAALLIQVSPGDLGKAADESRWVFVAGLIIHVTYVIITLLKGKLLFGLVGFLVPFIGIVGAIRLAKPTSFWARRFYGERKLARANSRFSEQYQQRWDRFRDAIGGDRGISLPNTIDDAVNKNLRRATHDDAPPPQTTRGPGK